MSACNYKKSVLDFGCFWYNETWYPALNKNSRGLTIMLGDGWKDRKANSNAKWLKQA